jgi:hypothetical protein
MFTPIAPLWTPGGPYGPPPRALNLLHTLRLAESAGTHISADCAQYPSFGKSANPQRVVVESQIVCLVEFRSSASKWPIDVCINPELTHRATKGPGVHQAGWIRVYRRWLLRGAIGSQREAHR